MKKLATTALVIASLLSAVSALAYDAKPHRTTSTPQFTLGMIACDNGVDYSAFFQDDSRRYGNEFNFGVSSQLSTVEMVHFGYFTLQGPYLFDIELWDIATCTFIASADNLAASDAYDHVETESFNVCTEGLYGAGRVGVMIDANSCYAMNDCYPDIEFDDSFPDCQWIITPGTPSLCQFSPNAGDFLLRIDLNACPTDTKSVTWGAVKQRYR